MAEEIPHPGKNIPKAILGTVAIGFITSWIYSIAVFFSIQDIEKVIATPTFVPSLEVFRQAVRGNIPGAVFLELLVVTSVIGCMMSIHTWQSRLVNSSHQYIGVPRINKAPDVELLPRQRLPILQPPLKGRPTALLSPPVLPPSLHFLDHRPRLSLPRLLHSLWLADHRRHSHAIHIVHDPREPTPAARP